MLNFHLLEQIRETDIETLERCVRAVTFGDLESEDARNLTEINFMRIFRLGQLTAEYLLHVQDRLAYDNTLLKASYHHIVTRLTRHSYSALDPITWARQKCPLTSPDAC